MTAASQRQVLWLPPEQADDHHGLVPNAVRFLAGYGIYVDVATELTLHGKSENLHNALLFVRELLKENRLAKSGGLVSVKS